eukprot:scaffold6280_cov79-Skeletonema_dohrnii-CCMP3373.AAC.4
MQLSARMVVCNRLCFCYCGFYEAEAAILKERASWKVSCVVFAPRTSHAQSHAQELQHYFSLNRHSQQNFFLQNSATCRISALTQYNSRLCQ